MFWLGYSGMPRRIHDYPAFMMGWHGMASVGHLITMVGVIFFFLMLIDSHYEKKATINSNLGLPRWHKRIQYYLFKIRLLKLNKKNFKRLPNNKIRQVLSNYKFNEW
jgi:heme/copper-type cytochrome/quinol oxidase subunit 1